jgi:pseudouridine-5'-phosphate glycosidase
MDDTAAVARMAQLHWAMGLGGILLANPVPAEAAIPADRLAGWIDAALADAEGAGIRGKDVTPHLLSAIARASDGATLEANRALLINNAALAGEVAMAMAKDTTA